MMIKGLSILEVTLFLNDVVTMEQKTGGYESEAAEVTAVVEGDEVFSVRSSFWLWWWMWYLWDVL